MTTLPGSLCIQQVPPRDIYASAGPDVLVVMCIGGGVTQEVTALQNFHSLKKIEYKSSFIRNDYQTVVYKIGKDRRGSTPVYIDTRASINRVGASFYIKVHRSDSKVQTRH